MEDERTLEQEEKEEVTIDTLMAESAKLKADLAKNKAALDKALKTNGELTKQLRAKMTVSEQEEEAKRVAEEAQANRIRELEEFKKRAEAKDRYTTLGMGADLAKEAADAEVTGDMDALASVYKRYQDATLKVKQEEWYKSRPVPESGHDESKEKEDPFLAGFNNY